MRECTAEDRVAGERIGAVRLEAEEGESFELVEGSSVVVGSSDGAGFVVRHPTVSAVHARVAHEGDAIAVVDLGSKNGVRVSGVRCASARLAAGGAFELGRARVRVELAPSEIERGLAEEEPLRGLLGGSFAMRRLARDVRRIAPLKLPALLRGESGSGKELVARAIHDESTRARRPFVGINAAAIAQGLAESELFGHARGAFTGADRDRKGAFREAQGGTLFLDEIAALGLDVQAKLLRAVEENAVRPLGGEAAIAIDVRLVVATCEPLEAMVAARKFRADLYERLAVCVVQVPRLADRVDDLPVLARHLLRASELGDREISAEAIARLKRYRWPGNVRELRNVIVQAALRAGRCIEAAHVDEIFAERSFERRRVAPEEALRLFEAAGRNISAAARRADVPRTTMRDLLRAAGVTPRAH